jgi:LacI family transcriptional regulator
MFPNVMLIVDPSYESGLKFLRGISKYASIYGPWDIDLEPPFYKVPGLKKRILSRLEKGAINGLIIRSTERYEEILRLGLPTVVFLNLRKEAAGFPCIAIDSVSIGEMGAKYLLGRGFRSFAYCGFDEMYWSRERGESFARMVAEAGFRTYFFKHRSSRKLPSWANMSPLLPKWLKSLTKPVGLMAFNDDCGQMILRACRASEVHVPEEIAVLGVTNSEVTCGLSNPPLSSIALNFEKVGYEAAELLARLMAGDKVTNQKIMLSPTHVVTRQSTDVLAIEDRDVARAVQYIRQNVKNIMQVNDVVRATSLSRRPLELRFRKILGRSILQEIRHARMSIVCQMLVETNMPLAEIASTLGYSSSYNLNRYFKREVGITPSDYRKQYAQK